MIGPEVRPRALVRGPSLAWANCLFPWNGDSKLTGIISPNARGTPGPFGPAFPLYFPMRESTAVAQGAPHLQPHILGTSHKSTIRPGYKHLSRHFEIGGEPIWVPLKREIVLMTYYFPSFYLSIQYKDSNRPSSRLDCNRFGMEFFTLSRPLGIHAAVRMAMEAGDDVKLEVWKYP